MIQPLGSDILLHPIEQPSSTQGGLHLPDAYKKKPVKGVVVARGPACKFSEISVGDVVLVSAYAGEKVSLADEGIFWLVQENDIAAVIHAEPKIRLIDTETVKRIWDECRGEWDQSFGIGGHVADYSTAVNELEEKFLNRLADLTQNEGFEF